MKKIIILLIAAMSIATTHAQLILSSEGQKMTCKAVENALFISKSSYRLKSKSDGKFYGRDGKKDFGIGYAVAVRTEEGVVMLSSQIASWNNDGDFQKVSSDYDAVLSSLELLKLDGSEALPVKRPAQYNDLYQVVDPQSKGGLDIVPNTGEINGWCVWLTTQSKSGEINANDVKCQANTMNIVVSDTTKTINVGKVPLASKVLGGIYVYPRYEGNGVIRYCVLGILDNTFGEWNIVFPFGNNVSKKYFSIETEEEDEKIERKKIQITPVEENTNKQEEEKKDKKKKKTKK